MAAKRTEKLESLTDNDPIVRHSPSSVLIPDTGSSVYALTCADLLDGTFLIIFNAQLPLSGGQHVVRFIRVRVVGQELHVVVNPASENDDAQEDAFRAIRTSGRAWSLAYRPARPSDSDLLSTQFVAGSQTGSIELFDWRDGQGAEESTPVLRSFVGHQKHVRALAVSPSGLLLVSGSWDHSARLWELETGNCIRQFCIHEAYVQCVAFDGSDYILTGSRDNLMCRWPISKYLDEDAEISNDTGIDVAPDRTYKHGSHVRGVTFVPGCPNQYVSCDDAGTLRVWDSDDTQEPLVAHAFPSSFMAIRALPDNGSVAFTTAAGDVLVWSCTRSSIVESFARPSTVARSISHTQSICILPDEHTLIWGTEDKKLLWGTHLPLRSMTKSACKQ